jgi:uncharacterized membrane protein YgdD (TMEM256/DUF423 family)
MSGIWPVWRIRARSPLTFASVEVVEQQPNRVITFCTAMLGSLGIAAAAFGAHGLEKVTDEPGVRLWAIAASIQLVTAPVLLALSNRRDIRPLASQLLLLGVLIFSGTLYALALGSPRVLGAITPLGGLCLIAGWILVGLPKKE